MGADLWLLLRLPWIQSEELCLLVRWVPILACGRRRFLWVGVPGVSCLTLGSDTLSSEGYWPVPHHILGGGGEGRWWLGPAGFLWRSSCSVLRTAVSVSIRAVVTTQQGLKLSDNVCFLPKCFWENTLELGCETAPWKSTLPSRVEHSCMLCSFRPGVRGELFSCHGPSFCFYLSPIHYSLQKTLQAEMLCYFL